MLRWDFSTVDLGRVRVENTPYPLWELILGIICIQSPSLPRRYWGWRARVLQDARTDERKRGVLASAVALLSSPGELPGFPAPEVPNAGESFRKVSGAPLWQLPDDLDRTFRRRLTATEGVAEPRRNGRADAAVNVLRQAQELLLSPITRTAEAVLRADRARLARYQLEGGADRLLSTLHPSIRWRGSVLEAESPADHTVKLGGRGLTIVPGYFCWDAPVTFIEPNRPPTLVVPASAADAELEHAEVVPDGAERLGRLLGVTRARLLGELAVSGSTTELARRLNVTPAAVSQHAKVLRDANLITTSRSGPAVRHALTPLGRAMLYE